MNTAGAALFAGLSRIADLDSLQDRVRAIAGDLLHLGLRRVDLRIFENWHEIAQAGAGESPLRWHLNADVPSRRALFGALAASEDDGVSVACGDLIASLKPAFVLEGDARGTCLIFVQLIAGTRVIGLVIIDTGDPEPPELQTLGLLRSYCDVAATLFDTERAALRVKRDAEISEVLARIGEHTRRTLDRRVMLEHVVNDVREAFKAARCVFYERDRGDPLLAHIVAIDDTKSIQAPLPRTHRILSSLLATMFERGEPLVLERIGDSPEHQLLRSRGVRAVLAVPIVSENGRIDAAMSIHFARERTFSQVDFVLARSIAMHLGLALANARLYETEQDARRRAEMLERNLRTIRGTRTVAALLNKVTETIVGEFGACGSAWSIRDGRFHCEAAGARKEAVLPSYAVGTSVAVRSEHLEALRAEKVILTRDDGALWSDVASKEAMIVPLFVDGELWGFLAARIDLKPSETDLDRTNFLGTLAAHTAMAIGNARAFEEQRRFAHERAALSEAARLILTFNEPEALAAAMTHLVLGLIGADRAAIYVPRDGNLNCIGVAVSTGEGPGGGIVAMSDPVLGRAFETGETQIEGEGHMVVLALPSTDHLAGILVCSRDLNSAAPFEPQDIHLLESFGGLLGLGLRNCELYDSETRANYALAESSEFKDDLLAMFTHDFRGPLTVIMGYAELLMESLSGEARADVVTIHAQAGRLVKLADDALRLARSQATGYSLERTKCDLPAFLAGALSRLGTPRVELRPAPEAPIRVSIDQERLLGAIENVVANALKFSTDQVEVRVEPGLGTARVIISDRGIGIPASDLEHIFHRFGRGANARRRGIAGTGIGLYTSRKVIEAHGGTISVDSTEGRGSTFTITLPTIVASEVPPAQPEPAAVAG